MAPSNKALRRAGEAYARKKVETSLLLTPPDHLMFESDGLPKFDRDELDIGKTLGKGNFAIVKALRRFRPKGVDNFRTTTIDVEEAPMDAKSVLVSQPMAALPLCVKLLKQEVIDDPGKYIKAIQDVAIETRILSSLRRHPHIIQLRATATCDPYNEGYFLILDRLHVTLENQLKTWQSRVTRANLLVKMVGCRRLALNQLLKERLEVALGVSKALEYLHERNIMHRDIKPENCGFDARGVVKIFDFGLATELRESMKSSEDPSCYNLTAEVGTMRYMAPEVALGKPYNVKSEVYSFALLYWQILSLTIPYEGYISTFHEKIHIGGKRPPIDESWSGACRVMLKRAWIDDLSARCSMRDMRLHLEDEIPNVVIGTVTTQQRKPRRVPPLVNKHMTGSA